MRRQKRNYKKIGKQYYSFDVDHERIIYEYLCMYKLKRKKLKKLNEEEKFNSFLEWEKYIYSKYQGYDSNGLLQFEKYLNGRLINIKPIREYWNMACTALFTLILSETIKGVTQVMSTPVNRTYNLISVFCTLAVICFALLLLIKRIIEPIWDNNTEENLYKDYIQIIEQMRQEKTDMKVKENDNLREQNKIGELIDKN